jgi:epoxyqueuosine reductase QueG
MGISGGAFSALASPPKWKAPESLTKKPRQNAAQREAERKDKEERERERLGMLEKYKREQVG